MDPVSCKPLETSGQVGRRVLLPNCKRGALITGSLALPHPSACALQRGRCRREHPTFPCLSGSVVQMSSICSKYRDISLVYRQPIFHIQAEESCTYYLCAPRLCSAKRKASPPFFVCFYRQSVPDAQKDIPLQPPVSPDFTCRWVEKPCLT